MAIHFSIIAWRIPWTKESSGLQSIASQVVGHDLKKLRLHTCPNITSQGLCHIHQFKKLISMPTRRCGTCIQWNITVIKKKEVMPFATTWMDLEIGNLSKTNQKKTNITWYHLYTETNKQKKIQMNSFSKQKQTHRLKEQTYGYQGVRMRVRNS